MVMTFAGKVALITGAAGGIGAAVAGEFAAAGATLALIDRSIDAIDTDGMTEATAIACDLGDPAEIDRAVTGVLERYGRLDYLVNIAGMMIFKPIEQLDAADWRTLLAVNLVAPALLTGQALRRMSPGGAIVNIASVHAHRTTALVAAYAASKAALASLTRSTAIEGRERGIRCNAILPGAVDTPMLHSSPAIRSGAERLDRADVGLPRDIAVLARFLASDEARFVNGAEVVADAGRMGRL